MIDLMRGVGIVLGIVGFIFHVALLVDLQIQRRKRQ